MKCINQLAHPNFFGSIVTVIDFLYIIVSKSIRVNYAKKSVSLTHRETVAYQLLLNEGEESVNVLYS